MSQIKQDCLEAINEMDENSSAILIVDVKGGTKRVALASEENFVIAHSIITEDLLTILKAQGPAELEAGFHALHQMLHRSYERVIDGDALTENSAQEFKEVH